jgi:hypothetical protein
VTLPAKALREKGARFFSGYEGVWRTAAVGLCAYLLLIGLLRITGKRTLSKMNAFDLVVTVALGSTLATILLSKDVALAEGIAAFLLLAGAQFAVTWTSIRSPRFRRWIKAEPRALLRDGQMLADALRSERVTTDEVEAAIRSAGHLEPGTRVVLREPTGRRPRGAVSPRHDGARARMSRMQTYHGRQALNRA